MSVARRTHCQPRCHQSQFPCWTGSRCALACGNRSSREAIIGLDHARLPSGPDLQPHGPAGRFFSKGQLNRRHNLSDSALPFRTSSVPIPSGCSDDFPEEPGDVPSNAEGLVPIKSEKSEHTSPPRASSEPPIRRCPGQPL